MYEHYVFIVHLLIAFFSLFFCRLPTSSLLLMKKGDPVSFSSPQHDAQAELDKTLHPRSSKAAALALRRKIQQVRGPRNSLGYDTVPSNLDGEDADDDEDDEEDEDDDDGDDEFEEMEKMTVGTQVRVKSYGMDGL